MKRASWLVALAVLELLLVPGCSADAGSKFDDEGSGDSGGETSGAGAGSSSGIGGGFGSQGSGAGGGGVDGCASDSYEAELVPIDLLFMVDQSGSMDDEVGGGTIWGNVVTAMKTFVDDPGAAGIGVGLQFFPIASGMLPPPGPSCPPNCTNCSCINGVCTCNAAGASCTPADYAAPEVEIAPLPGVGGAIKASLDAHGPSGGTPTGVALQGAIEHATEWGLAHPDRKVVVVLATDGEPSECEPQSIPEIAQLAANAANGDPSILTFVIGIGNLGALDQIAAAGGTSKAFIVDGMGNVSDAFLDALKQIENAVLACEYLIPQPNGETPDYSKLNVEYTPAGGGAPTTFGQVANAAACNSQGGWYYDDPANPTKILLCPAACDKLEADPGGKMEIVLGCATVLE